MNSSKKIIKWRQTVDICQSVGIIKHYLLLEIPFRAFEVISSLFFAFDWNVSKRIKGTLFVACAASVSSRVIARKLKREQKKKMEGGGGRVPSLPSPSPFIPFFALVPVFSTNSHGTACYAGHLIRAFHESLETEERYLYRALKLCLLKEEMDEEWTILTSKSFHSKAKKYLALFFKKGVFFSFSPNRLTSNKKR